MADPKPKVTSPLESSGVVPRGPARRVSYPGGLGADPIEAVRGVLVLALHEATPVILTLHVDLESTEPPRTISGSVREIRTGADGRDRVVLAVGDDVEQVVLLERIGHVDRGD